MKNKTLYSKIVSLKKVFLKKQIIPHRYAKKIDGFFNNFHNSFIQTKDITRDKIIQTKDISRDITVQYKDLSKDFFIQRKDLMIDKISSSQNTRKKNIDIFFEKNNYLNKEQNLFSLFFEVLKSMSLSLYYAKWNITEALDQSAVRNIKKIIVNSENVKSRVSKYYTRDSLVIYPPTETEKITFKQNGDFWLSVNRLTSEKKVLLQIEAFKKMPDKRLLIIGGFDVINEHVQSLFNQKPENVVFIQNVSEEDLREYYATCRGFITTAKDEDFGMTVVEAMAAGKAVIAPNEGGYKETILNGETGILIDEIDSEKIIAAVEEINDNLNRDNLFYRDKCINRSNLFSTKKFTENINKAIEESLYFDNNKQLIFIVGVPRSGTTWLWGLLTSHKDVIPLLKSDFESVEGEIDGKYKFLETNMLFDKSLPEIKSVLKNKNAKFIVEKTPDHLMKIERIKNEFPTAKIIHITRNPFSIFSSYKNSDWDKKDIPVEEWLYVYTKRMLTFIKHKDYKNLITVSYENLQTLTEKTLREIFSFIGLEDVDLKQIIETNHKKSKSLGKHSFRKAEINSWITEINDQEKDFIYAYLFNIRQIKKYIKIPLIEEIKLYLKSILNKSDFESKQLFFIVGVPRSGTTWVWKLISECKKVHTLTADDFKNFYRKTNYLETLEESNMLFNQRISRIKKVIGKIRKNIIVEKTPLHITKLDLINKEFPKAKIIHMVRNPFSVYASYKFTENIEWEHKDISVEEWVPVYKSIFETFKDKLESPNILNVSYDKLLNNTFEVTEQIYKFLNIETEKVDDAVRNFSYEKMLPIVSKKNKVNSLSGKLSDYEKNYIEDNLKEEINILKKYYE